ncbi:MAG: DUF541 domain-containing protein [Anaerolineales bacterium]|nr:MAG: DUF541 domain-containing protein [Anaerolineales bacterium]
MKRYLWGLLVLTFLLVGCSDDEQLSQKLTLSVAGYGQAAGDPDVADIQLGVTSVDANISKAVSEANRVNLAITKAVADLDIPSEDVQTGSYNVWREDIYNPDSGQPTGEYRFHVDITLTVRVLEVDKMGDVISLALKAGANNIYGINFRVLEPKQLEQAARAEAIIDLQSRAQQIADGLNMQLGAPLSVNEGLGPIPLPIYTYGIKGDVGYGGGGDMASASPVSPGQTSVSVQVNAIYELIPR